MHNLTKKGLALGKKKQFLVEIDSASLKKPNQDNAGIFSKWNAGANYLLRHCYSLACNDFPPDPLSLPDGVYKVSLPHPGMIGGSPMTVLNKDELARATEVDGFIPVVEREQSAIKPLKGHYMVAVFLMEITGEDDRLHPFYFYDYHYLRRDEKSGIWYQKPDQFTPVTNRDEADNIIYDPLKADFSKPNRTVHSFVGFYWAPDIGIKSNIEVQPVLPTQSVIKKGATPSAAP